MTKRLNKLFILLPVAVFALSVAVFTACDPGHYQYDLENLKAPVSAIELCEYDNPEQKHFTSWVPDHSKDLAPLDMDALKITATLEADLTEDFMRDLSKQHILYKYYAFNSPNGTCIRIVYDDGYFDIISCNAKTFAGYIGTFSPDGEVVDFIGCFASRSSYEYFLKFYFEK